MTDKAKDYLKFVKEGRPISGRKAAELIADGLLTKVGGAGKGMTNCALTAEGEKALAAA